MANCDPPMESTNACLCKHSPTIHDPRGLWLQHQASIVSSGLDWVLSAPLLNGRLRSSAGAQQSRAEGSETWLWFCAISQPRCLTGPECSCLVSPGTRIRLGGVRAEGAQVSVV